jgi:hypothetical protein
MANVRDEHPLAKQAASFAATCGLASSFFSRDRLSWVLLTMSFI